LVVAEEAGDESGGESGELEVRGGEGEDGRAEAEEREATALGDECSGCDPERE
jgi:hypothetical protein